MPVVTYTVAMPYSADISDNRYLQTTSKGNKFVRETAKIWAMCLRGTLNSVIPQSYSPDDLDNQNPFTLDIEIRFPRAFSKRSGDPGNFVKFPTDIVAQTLGVDDAGTGGSHKGSYGHGELACIILFVKLNTKVARDDKSVWLV